MARQPVGSVFVLHRDSFRSRTSVKFSSRPRAEELVNQTVTRLLLLARLQSQPRMPVGQLHFRTPFSVVKISVLLRGPRAQRSSARMPRVLSSRWSLHLEAGAIPVPAGPACSQLPCQPVHGDAPGRERAALSPLLERCHSQERAPDSRCHVSLLQLSPRWAPGSSHALFGVPPNGQQPTPRTWLT